MDQKAQHSHTSNDMVAVKGLKLMTLRVCVLVDDVMHLWHTKIPLPGA